MSGSHLMAGSQDSRPAVASHANDSRVPILASYEAETRPMSPAIAAWRRERIGAGGPFRPRYMVYSGLGSPAMTAERLRTLQEVGAESFLVATDLPSQLGFDPDAELAFAQVGRAGVSCATLADFETICSQLELGRVDSVGMLSNSVGHIGMGMVATTLRNLGAPEVKLMMQNDPLKEFTARGTEIHQPGEAVRIACDCVAHAIDEGIPGVALTVCSNHYDVAGTGPVLAMAFAFGNAIVYVDELVGRGYAVADIAAKLMFFLNERSDFFVEAAVFRAARSLWGELLADRYGLAPKDQPTMRLMGYAHGLESAAEPLVNLPRVTLSVLGSAMGGVDYLCATGYDEALRIPSVDAAALAVRTMQVVGNEHGTAATVDPLIGSAKLHDIEDYVATMVRRELDRLAEEGGSLRALESGYVKARIDEQRGTREGQLESGERLMVGHSTNVAPDHHALFAGSSQGEIDFARVEREVREGVEHQRAARGDVAPALAEVEAAAAGTENLLPPTIGALRLGATVEEIVGATREGFSR